MRSCSTLALCLILAGLAPSSHAASHLIDPAEVAPGSTGICLTEMDGGELVEIPLTVLGVAGPASPEGEIVLVRLEHERFAKTGIIAGMSGSPVYVDGRLLGALAFGWPFSTEPIGGVTPFVHMQRLAEGSSGAADATHSLAATRPGLLQLLRSAGDGALGRELVHWLTPEPSEIAPLPLTVSLSGMPSPTFRGWLADAWNRLGWAATTTPAGQDAAIGQPVFPGAMVAALLVDGDVSISTGGTVTEVRGDQVWAFGHPFLGTGTFSLPMARAGVVAVMPNQISSFKFFSVGETIGAFEVDRTHGVWGRLGQPVAMVPITLDASGRVYNFRCVRHPVLLPMLTAFLTEAGHAARDRSFGLQTVRVRAELGYRGCPPVVLEETYSGTDASQNAAALVGLLIGYLENTGFETPELESITISLRSKEEIERAEIVDAVPERTVVRPGQSIGVRLRLRPHRDPETVHRLVLQVPAEVRDGRIDLIVAAGGAWAQYDLRMRPFRPAAFNDELRLVDRLRPSTRLVVALERLEAGVALQGGHVPAPPSVVLALRSGLGQGLAVTTYRVVQLMEEEMPFSVIGAFRIPLEVRTDGPARTTEEKGQAS